MRALRLASLILLASPGCETRGEPCEFILSKNEVSSKIPTVGVVEWSLAGAAPSSARIVYALDHAAPSILNRGGEAPVRLDDANHRTLLLGLKQSSDYTFHIEAVRDGQTCVSPDYVLPTTGRFAIAPAVTVTVAQPDKREPGFIVTSSGTSVPNSAFIIDADGEIVWYLRRPREHHARAHGLRGREHVDDRAQPPQRGRGDALRLDGRGAGTARRRRARNRAPRLHGDARRQGRGARVARARHTIPRAIS